MQVVVNVYKSCTYVFVCSSVSDDEVNSDDEITPAASVPTYTTVCYLLIAQIN